MQAYNFRLTLTDDPSNRIPISRPARYDSTRYELLLRWKEVVPWKGMGDCFSWDRMPGRKTDVIACVSCTSYFLQGDFEYRHIDFNGVYTFGEIAYQLLNKTIVTLEVDIA